ncbi:hypothetical protein [Mucilaginibacter sp. dw_454]|uniref:hypothetical protein n=1 Tax=Mucilaginibacter sp. dw_454 TaxID=2720079 RepID=UPI001BD4321D|nr:hypothetical protein [Mucilaginibacter sp. dw_454]
MKQLEVFNKVGGILKELNEQYQYIQTNPEVINDLEMELFVANAHFLTDHAEILNKLNQRTKAEKAEETRADKVGTKADIHALPPPAPVEKPERRFEFPPKPAERPKPEPIKTEEPVTPAKPAPTSEKFFEPLVQQPKPKRNEPAETEEVSSGIDLSSDTPKDSYSFMMEEPEVIRHELEIDPADIDDDTEEEIVAVEDIEEVVSEPVKAEEPEIEAVEEPKIAVKEEVKAVEKKEEPAQDKEEVLTIHQRMSAQRASSPGYTEQAAQPVTNLKAAINLNDKLSFIKDLFNGYSLAYSEAIEILNRFNTFEEANRFLTKNYTLKNDWDSKPETADKFYAILKRRYS